MLIGLGTSGPNVIEHFHGVKFEKPFTRMREYIEIINMLLRQEKLDYQGDIFQLARGFTLRFDAAAAAHSDLGRIDHAQVGASRPRPSPTAGCRSSCPRSAGASSSGSSRTRCARPAASRRTCWCAARTR